ncbi:extracellular signal-regulated kinase 7 [Drosophila bipectinata]|uniref:extracellular signal-regulated kinase 7 n=1 Tax=Drosophila bipectinata TaxID=42026 RepID=UPI001C8A6992|nr:extracellular signal-regulated kinase 7 [Drosophila bipectinata]XP_017099610.2 extracellular signal-regulated kinase 7 [Drosophila bipectinata]XP_017099612.2 extracellular signal-regulated kinase 7 [Drosophila bipectinata]XP_017099613.2 extracellular signal-regulated kinase 7 [Drosophila bipectinata]
MASQPVTTAHERRIHELDHDVERIFDVRKRLGKGAYGIVWKATDKRHKETVALKKIFDAFRDETDAQRTYREVIFLRAFRHHPNIIRLMDIFKAANDLDFYLVFEFMESDLHNVIKKGDVLKDIHKRFVMYQLINAIQYMHSGNVIHRDLKPSNILIDSKCRLKVADFGLARTLSMKRKSAFDDMENDAMLTDYVATRWYRAPEILVASRKYTKGIDMWSLGCILGEMIRQKPLFQGTSTINQIEKIVTALPDVTQSDIESIGASFGTVLLSKKINRDRRHSLDEMLRNCCDDAMSLVKGLLVLDPLGRLTAKEAIMHSFVSRFRTASADMELRLDVSPPLQDDVRYGVDEYRASLYDMIGTDSRSSARKTAVTSSTAHPTPGSSREAVTSVSAPKGQLNRSVSRARTTSASQKVLAERQPPPQRPPPPAAPQRGEPEKNTSGVNILSRNLTQSWAEQHCHKRTSLHHHPPQEQPHLAQQQQQPQSRPQEPMLVSMATITSVVHQKHRSKDRAQRHAPQREEAGEGAGRGEGTGGSGGVGGVGERGEAAPGPGTSQSNTQTQSVIHNAERNMVMARNTHAALRKELAAVAATAPRKKSSFWHDQAKAHIHDSEARMEALLRKAKIPLYRSPLERAEWGGDKSSASGETDSMSPHDRSRSQRKLQKEKKPRVKTKVYQAGEDRAREGRAGEGRAGEGRAVEGRAGEGRAGEDRARVKVEERRAEEGRAREDRARKDRAREEQIREDRPREDRGREFRDRVDQVGEVKPRVGRAQEDRVKEDCTGDVRGESDPQAKREPTSEAKLQRRRKIERERQLKHREWQQRMERTQRVVENERLMELERRQLEDLDLQKKRLAAKRQEPRHSSGTVAKRRIPTATTPFKTHLESDRKSDEIEQSYPHGRIESEQAKKGDKPPAKDKDLKAKEPKNREPKAREPKEKPKTESKGQGLSSIPPSTAACYISRISYLEAEMAKCKRQLVSFVQDNQEVLTHRKLRYHFEQLKTHRSGDSEDTGDEDVHEPFKPGRGAGGGDSDAQSYQTFLQEQSRQKQLQLKEFLARDESNDYEHPDLSNVYKVRSYHAFARDQAAQPPQQRDFIKLFQIADASERVDSPEARKEPLPNKREFDETLKVCRKHRERIELNRQLGHCHRHHAHHEHHHHHHSSNHPRNPHQQHLCHRHRAAGGPTYEHMCLRPEDIQEAQFVEPCN